MVATLDSPERMTTRRCRPLLGTFVEITASGSDEERVRHSIDAAFNRIERIQNLMSVHDPDSELSQVNACALLHEVSVSDDTFSVLERGLELARESVGAFDFTIAPTLAHWNLLPAHLLRQNTTGNWQDVKLLSGRRVRFTKPVAIDVGGIAKGCAVDAAIEMLQSHGACSAMVNAGGDLRVFGHGPSVIHLRHPTDIHSLPHSIELQNASLATSSPSVTECKWRDRTVSHLVNPTSGRAVTGDISVTVRAQECWLADALTKVVLNAPALAEALMNKHNAEAYIFSA
jgi:thiamine biosynthesis lipoprotein